MPNIESLPLDLCTPYTFVEHSLRLLKLILKKLSISKHAFRDTSQIISKTGAHYIIVSAYTPNYQRRGVS
jgi:hypothetical protein